jgi:tight adherence protein C
MDIAILMCIVLSAVLAGMGLSATNPPRGLSMLDLAGPDADKTKRPPIFRLFGFMTPINKILVDRFGREKLSDSIVEAGLKLLPEEFLLMWELYLGAFFLVVFYLSTTLLGKLEPGILLLLVMISFMVPRFWLKMRTGERRRKVLRDLPDAIDLVALCVNAGLDFSRALKWVIDKSRASPLVEEFQLLLVETKVGKSRRQALKDMAKRVKLREMSSFSRSLIQAERLGTPLESALNIIADDIRDMRFRRGERAALLAPLKMLFPLIFFIMPTVGIVVAGPVILKFITTGLPKF